MSTRTINTLLLSLLVAMAAACGDETDPSKSSNNANNTQTNNNTTSTNNNTTSTNNNTTSTNNNTTSTNNNTTTTNNNTTPVQCLLLENFYGQIGAEGEHSGGAPDANGTLDFDAGLQAAYDATPLTEDNMDTADVNEGRVTVDLQVTGALVTATTFDAFANKTFWLQDQNTAIRVRLDAAVPQDTVIKVGQKVSFHITELQNFGGIPQIAVLDSLVVDSEGNAVPYREATGTDITIDDFDKNVRVFGTITDAGMPCGGDNNCFTLAHGDKTTIFRTKSQFIEQGDCLTFTGPASGFPGPLATGEKTIQVDQVNFDWAFEQR
ncbi:MAG: hypothetical protein R3E66_18865 [bacterium]